MYVWRGALARVGGAAFHCRPQTLIAANVYEFLTTFLSRFYAFSNQMNSMSAVPRSPHEEEFMIAIAIYLLEVIFAAGIIGSAVVIVLTAIEDVHAISKVEDQ